ncbi:MAG: hypothetical protein JNK67_12220 [Alphaproteobacteria bacterium]|nr:hypothetical protein [Alphaproteobacteria bacterium]
MNRIKSLVLALLLSCPGIAHAEFTLGQGGAWMRAAAMREMFAFGTFKTADDQLGGGRTDELEAGYTIAQYRVQTFFANKVIVIGSVKKKGAGQPDVIFEMEVINGELASFRTISESSPGWSHERNSVATGGNDGGGGDSM